MKLNIFQLRVSNSKVKKWKFILRVSNSKFNLIFYKVELVTRKKNFNKHFQVSNLKCDIIKRYSISLLENSEPRLSEKRTQFFEIKNLSEILSEIADY